jgi:HIRAN domain
MTTTTNSYLSRLVGNNHRLAGSLILPILKVDQELILEPEPDNPYDAEAVKVCVDMTGSPYTSNASSGLDGPIIQLGYLPRSGTRTDTTGFGNRQALRIMHDGPNWAAYLTFSPQGDPLVRIVVTDSSN